MIKWDNRYATGNNTLDEQHRELFSQLNRLEELAALPKISSSEADALVDFFGDYARNHFCFEEKCAECHSCGFAEENKKDHARFLAFIKKFREEYREAGPTQEMLDKLYRAASKWLHFHILKIDVKLKAGAISAGKLAATDAPGEPLATPPHSP